MVRALRCILERVAHDPGIDSSTMLLRYREADVVTLTREVCAPFESLALARNIEFVVDTPDYLDAEFDIEKLELIFLTLLFNAFKYTPEGGRIELYVRDAARDNEVEISLLDSGQAIAPHLAAALFDRTRQLDRSVFFQSRELGIGLGAARDSAVLHGGNLELVGARDLGAEFRVRLPRRAPRGALVHPRGEDASGCVTTGDLQGVSTLATRVAEIAREELADEQLLGTIPTVNHGRPVILIIEDSRALQRILKHHLEPLYDTVAAFDTEAGLDLARRIEPDLIVLDVEAQASAGETFITELRKNPGLDGIPILALTEADDPAQTLRLLSDFVQDVVRKPFLLPEVGVRVKNLVESKLARDVLRAHVGRHEADLVKLAEEVMRHQTALAQTLEEVRVARELAESASRIKSNFLRMVSHELKTPVAAIQLYIRVLERDPRLGGLPPLTEGLSRIGQSTQRLVHLVDTIVEWARVESGRCKVLAEPLDAARLAGDISRELSRYAEAKKVQLTVSLSASSGIPADFVTDARIARLVALDLGLRAIQITDSGRVDVAIDFDDLGRFRLRVRDNALTVGPRERVMLFEPLRSDYDVRWTEGAGSGLGLYVVRDIARALDGDVTLEANPVYRESTGTADTETGRGNVITLVLPNLPHDRTPPRASSFPHSRAGSSVNLANLNAQENSLNTTLDNVTEDGGS